MITGGSLIPSCLWENVSTVYEYAQLTYCIRRFPFKSSSMCSEATLKAVITLQQSLLIDFELLQAKRLVALLWTNVDMPSRGMWTKELTVHLALER